VIDLKNRNCAACIKGGPALTTQLAAELLPEIPGWQLNSEAQAIGRTLRFKNFHETMAFVNAVAWIAHRENHHPDLEVGYDYCTVHYRTHAVDGLSENDFICAAKINALLATHV
jgi:4a-hydroxytetrahydrobiopterin dehydratase